MRTLVDIPDEDVALVNEMAKVEGVSRAEWVRRAISNFLAPHRSAPRQGAPLTEAFGIWKDRPVDGLEYQERMRGEWSERSSTQTS